jgi:hypothetical protein
MAVPANLLHGHGDNHPLIVEDGVGYTPGTNALKWTQGNEWGNGWTGMGFTIEPPFNLAGAWQQDSVKFKMKAEEGVGALRVQFESGPEGKPSEKRIGIYSYR